MFLRITTAAIGLPVVVAAVWFGGAWLLALLVAAVVLGTWEFSRLAEQMGGRPSLVLTAAAGIALLLNAYWGWSSSDAIIGASALALLSRATFRIWLSRPARRDASTARDPAPHLRFVLGWALGLAGVLYLGWTLSHALLMRALPDGQEWLLTVAAVVFATDTAAYLVGRTLGRHRMAPALSPKKTWEGAVGGAAGGLGVAMGLVAAFSLPLPWWQALLLGGSITLAAEVGDLAESLLKRASGAGESGGLLPGHGGILDRLDSIVFGLVAGYYAIAWVVP